VAVVKVKSHYQVTLPPQIRTKARVEVGDLFEAKVEGRTITLVPKRTIDRELALALNEVKRGRVKGPFSTAQATVRALRRRPA
jgi:bifunctional DNA-binding transcriptional regulator/antitoxin component of YhaV-PrlF toxin-antitoxin module